jgi:hypothetical protein
MKTFIFKTEFKTFLISLILIFFLSSCNVKPGEMPSSSGKTCEILVVIEKSLMEGNVGDTLRSFFMQEQVGLNQSEPLFTLPYIPYSSFENTAMFQTHRNIVVVNINDSCKTKMEILKNFKSKPQLVFNINAPNKTEFFKIFSEKKEIILGAFNDLERTRINAAFKANESHEVNTNVTKTFDFKMIFPSEFIISKKTKDFAWIRLEAKDYSQGILIYTFPYLNKSDLDQKHIISIRDSLTKQWIPGPTDGSYMTTEKRFPILSKEINFNGIYALETRGLWKLENDFMGGPFINYAFVDQKKNRIIMIDGYLYSPKKSKRDLLKQIEAIIYTYKSL